MAVAGGPRSILDVPPESTILLKPSEVAAKLAVSRTWVYEAARTGRLPSIRIGGPDGPLRFVPQDLDRWLDEARSNWVPGGSSTPSRD